MANITDYIHHQIAQFDNACQTAKPSMIAYLANYFAKIDRLQADTLWVKYGDDLDLFVFCLDKTGKGLKPIHNQKIRPNKPNHHQPNHSP